MNTEDEYTGLIINSFHSLTLMLEQFFSCKSCYEHSLIDGCRTNMPYTLLQEFKKSELFMKNTKCLEMTQMTSEIDICTFRRIIL